MRRYVILNETWINHFASQSTRSLSENFCSKRGILESQYIAGLYTHCAKFLLLFLFLLVRKKSKTCVKWCKWCSSSVVVPSGAFSASNDAFCLVCLGRFVGVFRSFLRTRVHRQWLDFPVIYNDGIQRIHPVRQLGTIITSGRWMHRQLHYPRTTMWNAHLKNIIRQ